MNTTDTVIIAAIPEEEPIRAAMIRNVFRMLYHLSPRWHQEPILCMGKGELNGRVRKVLM